MSSSADNVIGLYERHAAAWTEDRQRGPFLERQWLDRFIRLIPAGGPVLDIGCGPGAPIAEYMIKQGVDVSGVDSSAAMIALCRARFPDKQWTVADMRTLSLPWTFQGLLAWDSFFHLSRHDQRSMFPIFGKHAAPGAPLMFTAGPMDGEAIGSLQGEELFHASLAEQDYRALLAANGFQVLEYVAEDPECGRRTVWLAQKL